MPEVIVVGAGIVGSACAYELARAGCSVTVLDRGSPAGGTTSRGEGNILVSDKGPGPELALAQASQRRWLELADELGDDAFELERKGGVVVATAEPAHRELLSFAADQSTAGVRAEPVDPTDLRRLEPLLAPDLPGGVLYPDDLQVQPVLAAVSLLAGARRHGATVRPHTAVAGLVHGPDGGLSGVRTEDGSVLGADVVINAAGTWGGEIAERCGAPVPVLPRRGIILVTEPLPPVIAHKVYSADYVANVASGDAGLETSVVVESTRGGTVLIGASRERVGFDTSYAPDVVATLARQAVAIFPFLARVALMRTYTGFRPYCPDHLPVIGPDARLPGLWHACGHEGAGIGLAPATGRLIADQLTGRTPEVDPTPFSPARFTTVEAAEAVAT